MNITISIITASYNYAQYISETIESVINQTYPNWELIIVDDGSTDNSVEIIKSYCQKDSRIKLYQHKNGKNRGLKETILLGVNNASNEWIAFCESDDYLAPNYLEEKVKIINQNKDVNFIFNNYEIIGDLSYLKTVYYENSQKLLKKRAGALYCYSDMCVDYNPVATFSAVMLKKSLLKNLDYNTPVATCLDYYLWIQIAAKENFYFIDEKLTYWRKHSDSYWCTHTKFPKYIWKLILSRYNSYFCKTMIKKTLFAIFNQIFW